LAFGSGGLHNASHDEEDRHMAQHLTRNDLPAGTRGKACDRLNARLADARHGLLEGYLDTPPGRSTRDRFAGTSADSDKQLWRVEAHRQADS
jgi:hypothetical protein